MKLFVNARFLTQPISGVQRYAIECSRQIKRLYKDVVFLAPKNIIHKDIASEFGVITVGYNTGHLWEQVDLPLYLSFKKSPPLLSMANTAPILYSNNFVSIHDLAFYHHAEWNSKMFGVFYNILIPRLAYNCKHIFTVSETIRNEIQEHYKIQAGKISVTYNGIGSHLYLQDNEIIPLKEKRILAVGTFNIRKNHQNLIKAFLKSDIKHNYNLIIIGEKNKVFKDTGIDEDTIRNSNVQILQRLTDDELKGEYLKASILVSLSDYEGFGIPVLEGAYFGCKVLCSDIPVYRELFADIATFCDQHNIDAIAAALYNLSLNHNTFDKAIPDKLAERYNYKKSAITIISLIDPLAVIPTE